ncbi:MAG: hypothetical protein WCG28_03990 [bacterium]
MEEDVEKFYKGIGIIAQNSTIDLSNVDFMHPWDIGEICLMLIERQSLPDKKLILPKNKNLLSYLKRIHFDQFLNELGYKESAQVLSAINSPELENLNLQEITHCRYVDEFSGRLGHFERMFKNFGLNDEDAKRALVIVGELGNNVFDHNIGSWPTNFNGSIILAQNYPQMKRIEVVVADAGVGFLGSLKNAYPDLMGDIEAIKKGLEGYSGRIGENRGNGLRLVQKWTIKNFHGILFIRSGAGLVQVDEDGCQSQEVAKVVGTNAKFVIYYS